jgi:transcriptional regulator with XRE-family HTH domain
MTNVELKNNRIQHGLSQRELASLLGVRYRTYQGWESERRKRPLPTYIVELIERAISQLSPQWVGRRRAAIKQQELTYKDNVALREAAKLVPLEIKKIPKRKDNS